MSRNLKVFGLLSIALVMLSLFWATAAFAYTYDTGGKSKPTLDITLSTSCDENLVTVSDDEKLIANAHVRVRDTTSGEELFVGDTDDKGQFSFPGCAQRPDLCGRRVDIRASHTGYLPNEVPKDLFRGPCGCTADTQCPADQRCLDGSCVPVDCPCGAVATHACSAYDCCSDSDCPAGQTCQNHVCVAPPPEEPAAAGPSEEPQCIPPECCTSDSQCADNQRCEPGAAAPTGSCRDIVVCGTVANHEVVETYECGTGTACSPCPSGQTCENNRCVTPQTPPSDANAAAAPEGEEQPPAAGGMGLGLLLFGGFVLVLLLFLFWFFYLRNR